MARLVAALFLLLALCSAAPKKGKPSAKKAPPAPKAEPTANLLPAMLLPFRAQTPARITAALSPLGWSRGATEKDSASGRVMHRWAFIVAGADGRDSTVAGLAQTAVEGVTRGMYDFTVIAYSFTDSLVAKAWLDALQAYRLEEDFYGGYAHILIYRSETASAMLMTPEPDERGVVWYRYFLSAPDGFRPVVNEPAKR